MPHVDAKRTHFGVSFLFSFLSPVPADTPPFQAKAPPSELTPACSSSLLDCISQLGLPLGCPLCRRCPLRTALPHAVIARCAAKLELPTGGSPSQQSKSKQAAPPGAGGKTRQSKRHPLSGGCPVLFLGSFFLPADLFQVQAVFQNVAHSIEQSDAEQQ